MNSFMEYQLAAERTLAYNPDPAARNLQLAVIALGLAGESGEVVEMIKKHVGHGHALDTDKLYKELGDVLWYISAIATLTGLELVVVAEKNIEKLSVRYPSGFSKTDSILRRDEIAQVVGVLKKGLDE